MTVEASLILPIFLMLMMNLLSVIEVYRIHGNISETLWAEGRKMAKYLYLKEKEGELDVSQVEPILASLSAKRQIIKNLENYPIWEKIVGGGKSGFSVFGRAERDGMLYIDCSYRIHPLFPSLTPVSKEIKNHYYGYAWIGYVPERRGASEEQQEIYVYVTETGTVYHKNRGCSYLNPSIQNISAGEWESIRNRNGAIYYACPICGDTAAGGSYYITDYGTNYHSRISCSGLKRTIYEVKLSEVGRRNACSRCGG